MPDNIPYIRVFISSPGDVTEERQLALNVIEQLPYRPVFRDRVAFRIVAWDKDGADTTMRMSMTPQDAINAGLPRPSECDIVIVIFWSRMGTPFDDQTGVTYESGTHWELLDALDGERSRERTVLYRRMEEPRFTSSQKEAIAQHDRLKAFFASDLFQQDGRIKRGVNQYDTPDAFRRKFESHFEGLVVEILSQIDTHPLETNRPESAPDNDNVRTVTAEPWNPERSPFPGLSAFTQNEADIFFGRGRETDALVQQVRDSRFVAVVGASGSGKSSLVAAGLLPRLADKKVAAIAGSADWYTVRFTPGEHPLDALAEALMGTVPALDVSDPIDYPERLDKLVASLRRKPENLIRTLDHALRDEKDWVEVLLFVDQFEELFTLSDPAETALFAQLLAAVAESERVRAVVTMRHDFYHKAVENVTLAELLRADAVFSLAIPKRDALREMIERPADCAGLTWDADLVTRILDDTGNQPGNLALMAYALDELYKRSDGTLTAETYEALGGVQGAIGTRAEAEWQKLEMDDSVLQQVFRGLVEVDERGTATRRREQFRPDELDEAIYKVIDTFTRERLLTTNYDQEQQIATVEVAHEAILRQWERLVDWIEEVQEDLILLRQVKNAASDWDRQGRPDFLRWNHERLELVYAMLERLHPDLTETEQAFIEPEQERLYRELETLPKDPTSHERRRDIGDRLAVIGDTRTGVGLREDGIPDMAWIPITQIGNIDIEGITFEVQPFYVSKYLVTYAQYQAFADADYDNPDWWAGFPEKYQPQKLDGARTKIANAPRDSISWYQAVAYSRWLDVQLRRANLLPDETMQVRLPTEWEWQWLAQNGQEIRAYPWGEWQEGYANTSEAGLSRTTSVGMYPYGEAACGARDMSGNLREWCLNDYSNPTIVDGFGNGERKVLRGGAFPFDRRVASASYRSSNGPFTVNAYDGCRLVVSPKMRL